MTARLLAGAFALALTLPVRAAEPPAWVAKLATLPVERYAAASAYCEGPTWHNGELFFCSNGLLRVTRDRQVRRHLDLLPNGTVLLGNGHLVMCDNKLPALVDLAPDGTAGVVVERFEGRPLNSLNDLTVDAAGNVYWTDPNGSTRESPTGKIFRVRPDGRVDRLADNLAYPNGLEVDAANKHLYVIESQTAKILRYDLPQDDQPLGRPVVWHALGGTGGDGCCYDAAGNLWVADFHRPETKRGRVVVVNPEGERIAAIDMPTGQVSNVTFGGPNFDELFVTTGEPPGVYRVAVGVKGWRGHPGKALKVVRALDVKAVDEPVK